MSTDATDVDHCEVAFNADDGFEFFGGTVNVKYLSALFVGDYSFAAAEPATAQHAALASSLALSTTVANPVATPSPSPTPLQPRRRRHPHRLLHRHHHHHNRRFHRLRHRLRHRRLHRHLHHHLHRAVRASLRQCWRGVLLLPQHAGPMPSDEQQQSVCRDPDAQRNQLALDADPH